MYRINKYLFSAIFNTRNIDIIINLFLTFKSDLVLTVYCVVVIIIFVYVFNLYSEDVMNDSKMNKALKLEVETETTKTKKVN